MQHHKFLAGAAWERSGHLTARGLHALPAFVWVFSRSTGYYNLPIAVNVRINNCSSLCYPCNILVKAACLLTDSDGSAV